MTSASHSSATMPTTVPSPTTDFDQYLPHLTSALDKLTTNAAALPDKSDLSFHKTLDRGFAKDLDDASERVLKLTERLLSLVDQSQHSSRDKGNSKVPSSKTSSKVKGRRRKLEDEDDVVDGFRQSVVGVVDGLLEDADSCLDEVRGEKKKAAIAIKPHLVAQAGQKLPGPFSKQAARLPRNILHANDLAKPQLLFPDQVDNTPTTTPWKPNLITKPHAMVPIGFVPPLDFTLTREEELDPSKEVWRRQREIRMRQHPYFYETRHLPYPTSLFIDSQPIPPKSFQETPFEFVDTPEQLELLVEKLKKAKEIAVDLEHHNMRSYSGFTCLIQISTREGDWVIDSLKLRKELRENKLGDVMTDPGIIKVFHGSESDIVWLQHDFDIFVVNLFDTYHATVVLDMKQHGLASLLQQYCNFEADKRYQMADWRIRPLPDGMLHYARSDTHFLLYVYDNLRNALLEQSSRPPSPDPNGNPIIETTRRNPQQAMREVLGRSADTALRLYEKDEYDEETGKGSGGWMGAARKWLPKGAVDEEPGWVWRKLHAWRDRLGRELDESPIYIMPQDTLKNLSLLRGTAPILIKQAINPDRAPLAAARMNEITDVIKQAKAEWVSNQVQLAKQAEEELQSKANQKQKKPTKTVFDPKPVPDVWDAITIFPNSATKLDSVTPQKSKSGLFGSTIKSKPLTTSSSSSSAIANSDKLGSSLFGQTLQYQSGKGRKPRNKPAQRGNKELSPGFDNVQNTIHEELQPIQKTDLATPIIPEQVPYIPSKSRTTNLPVDESPSISSHNPTDQEPVSLTPADHSQLKAEAGSEKKKKKEDGIVQVKKTRKPKRERGASSSIPSTDGKGKKVKLDTPPESPQSLNQDQHHTENEVEIGTSIVKADNEKGKEKKPRKDKKAKLKVEEIPEFDYSSMPNLLDQPSASSKDASSVTNAKDKKKKKKDKKGGIGAIETPVFGPKAARDLSQPKGGNKSGTFV
ncbi:uncharacterized protein IL334_000973 [Kwoniella shivajii]|uniref:3'-5' exonuclease domain-containing protein n=1 Tax=Kwoniella shivajii TaxID=564305 RepID=A0ABZ1CQN3_9TREE|nr:hypothetical protein IL334_000973 [Kwoniella shivajii]